MPQVGRGDRQRTSDRHRREDGDRPRGSARQAEDFHSACGVGPHRAADKVPGAMTETVAQIASAVKLLSERQVPDAEPKMAWPVLSDRQHGPRDAEKFVE